MTLFTDHRSQFHSFAECGNGDVFVSFAFEGLLEMFLGLGFAVNEEEVLDLALVLTADVTHHLAVVAVAGEGLNAAQLGTHGVGVSEDGDTLVSTHNLGSECLGLTVAHAENGCCGVFDMVCDVVLYAASLHHARCGDDNTGFVAYVEGFGGLDGLNILQTVEPEWVGVGLHVFRDVIVEAFGMESHDVGGGDAQRAIYKDVDVWQQFGMFQTVEGVDDFLSAADGERGDDEFAAGTD